MKIFVKINGEQAGPFSEEAIKDQVARGTLKTTDLGWHDKLESWLPLLQIVPESQVQKSEERLATSPATVPATSDDDQSKNWIIWCLVGLLAVICMTLLFDLRPGEKRVIQSSEIVMLNNKALADEFADYVSTQVRSDFTYRTVSQTFNADPEIQIWRDTYGKVLGSITGGLVRSATERKLSSYLYSNQAVRLTRNTVVLVKSGGTTTSGVKLLMLRVLNGNHQGKSGYIFADAGTFGPMPSGREITSKMDSKDSLSKPPTVEAVKLASQREIPPPDLPETDDPAKFVGDFYEWMASVGYEPSSKDLWEHRQLFDDKWIYGAPLVVRVIADRERLSFNPFTGNDGVPKKKPVIGDAKRTGEHLVALGDNYVRDNEIADVRVQVSMSESNTIDLLIRKSAKGWTIVDIDFGDRGQLGHLLDKVWQVRMSEQIVTLLTRYCEAHSAKNVQAMKALFSEKVSYLGGEELERQAVVKSLLSSNGPFSFDGLSVKGSFEFSFPSDDPPSVECVLMGRRLVEGKRDAAIWTNLKCRFGIDIDNENARIALMEVLP